MQALSLGGFLPGRGANSTQLSVSLIWVHALTLGGSRYQLAGANSPHLSLSVLTQLHRSLAGGDKDLRSTDRGLVSAGALLQFWGGIVTNPGETRVSIQT